MWNFVNRAFMAWKNKDICNFSHVFTCEHIKCILPYWKCLLFRIPDFLLCLLFLPCLFLCCYCNCLLAFLCYPRWFSKKFLSSRELLQEVIRIKSEHPDDSHCIVNDRVKGRLKVTRAFGAGFLKQVCLQIRYFICVKDLFYENRVASQGEII